METDGDLAEGFLQHNQLTREFGIHSPNAGGRVCYLRDPDGVTIEFIEKANA